MISMDHPKNLQDVRLTSIGMEGITSSTKAQYKRSPGQGPIRQLV